MFILHVPKGKKKFSLYGIDWLKRKVKKEKLGIHWTLTSALEDTDFTDYSDLVSHTQQH